MLKILTSRNVHSCFLRNGFSKALTCPLLSRTYCRMNTLSNTKLITKKSNNFKLIQLRHLRNQNELSKSYLGWKLYLFILCMGGTFCTLAYFINVALEDRYQTMQNMANVGSADIGGPFELINTKTGKLMTDKDFLGQWTLVYFGFTKCPDVCPSELDKIVKAIDVLDQTPSIVVRDEDDEYEEDKDVTVKLSITESIKKWFIMKIDKIQGYNQFGPLKITPIFITVDPERDNCQVINEYLAEFSNKFVGLTTDTPETIKKIAKAYRIYYSPGMKDADNDYIVDHSIISFLMSPNGEFINFYSQRINYIDMAESIRRNINVYNSQDHSNVALQQSVTREVKDILAKKSLYRCILMNIQDVELCLISNHVKNADVKSDYQEFITLHGDSTEPLYILFHCDTYWLFIMYIPETSSVRHKMLYAGTRSTLKREINESIKEYNVYSKKDLEFSAYRNYSDSTIPPPLTQAEISLQEVNHQTTMLMNQKLVSVSSGAIEFPIDDILSTNIKSFNKSKYNYLRMKIKDERFVFDCHKKIDFDQLINQYDQDEPRYHLFNIPSENKIVFIYTLPESGCKIKDRMIYASSRSAIVNYIKKFDVEIFKNIEVDGPDGLNITNILQEINPQNYHREEVIFEKAKMPGRRTRKKM
ncbi:hypothetical protein A3Q56_00594 [Intoshia linei]|uniref:ADF-H domain-containing protein n=1 Tax=Intoshia linei TaxID=1819745 RepID=A0A177BBN9_9BILA|nr:hypothetical protein A3Q56_00594 [Intoshia linei]